MKYLIFLFLINVIFFPYAVMAMDPPTPELAVPSSSSGSSGENISTMLPPRSSHETESRGIVLRKAFFESHKQKSAAAVNKGNVYRRDSAMSEELVLQANINRIRGIRRGSTLAAAADAYIKAAQATPTKPPISRDS